ncbi:MAG: hypothetical protein I8H71_04330 [Xanthomonadaceae bacterium]|nr:hypothetical protein [Xanthomonadaceae bacterium]
MKEITVLETGFSWTNAMAQSSKKQLIAIAVCAALMPVLAKAAVVHSNDRLAGGNSWFADITVVNDGPCVAFYATPRPTGEAKPVTKKITA